MTDAGSVRIDAGRLREVAAGCGWSLTDFAEFYAPRARSEVEDVRAALAGGDLGTVARLAHGAAGSSATVGMESLSELYREIDRSARAGVTDGLAERLSAVDAHLTRALERLEEMARGDA